MLATQLLGSEQNDSQTLQEVVYQTMINLYIINIFYKEYLNMSYQKVFLSSIFEHSFLHSFLYCRIEQTSKNSTLSHSLCIKHHHYGFLSNPRTSHNNLSQSMFSLISSILISEQCLPTEVTICICNPNSKRFMMISCTTTRAALDLFQTLLYCQPTVKLGLMHSQLIDELIAKLSASPSLL